jgi:bifunctional ADP-heptose synthase (sugar kinase/adenylyltransferase)
MAAGGCDTRRKILGGAELASRLEEHRARGERIVLASGSFDLLQAADVRYLERARREAEVLVVVVDSDVQLRSRLGSDRPIVPAEGRAQLVAALGAVHYVTVRGDAGAAAVLDALRPDVYAAKGDAAETAREREAARKAGIRIARLGEAGEDGARDVATRLRHLLHG